MGIEYFLGFCTATALGLMFVRLERGDRFRALVEAICALVFAAVGWAMAHA